MFNLKAGNEEIILTSERYAAKAGAEIGIASVQRNSPHDARYDRKTSSAGYPYFVPTAANNQVIGRSEVYSSVSARENGIELVKKNGSTTDVRDET